MKNSSTIVPLIHWTEGMALSQHHFQQSDLRTHQVLAHHLNLISFHHWGIQELRIDPAVLPDGVFRVLSAELAMPDGLAFHYDANSAHPLEIDLNPFKPQSSTESLTVQIAVPSRVAGVSPLRMAVPRFDSIDGEQVNDENTDDNPITIRRLIPRFVLSVGELPARHAGFPIARVHFSDNAFALVNYTPPCFQVEPESHLWAVCAEMAGMMRAKALGLCEKWQSRVGTSLLQETAEMLKPLVTILPTLESLVSSRCVSPASLYENLVRAAGIISQLHLSQVPPNFVPYDHNEIDLCILPLLEYICDCIEHLSLEYVIFPFQQHDGVFSFKLNPAYLGTAKEIFVGVRARRGMASRLVEEWMKDAIVVSDGAIQKVQSQRVTGAARMLVEGEKLTEISPPRETLLFAIQIDPQFIMPAQYLHIFNPSDTLDVRPADIVLYVPKDERPPETVRAA